MREPGPLVELTCTDFAPGAHRPGTKGAGGQCSWTEDCASEPTFSAVVRYEDSGRGPSYALCPDHHFRVHQYFSVAAPPVDEVRHLLECWAEGFARACRTTPTHARDHARDGRLGLGSRGLEDDEARAFVRAWRSELPTIWGDGEFSVPGARACPSSLHLVGRSGDAVALHTEYLIHIGMLAELVEDAGWDPTHLAFEQGEWDVLGFDGDRVCLAVEAKARAHRPDSDSLESLRDSLLLRSREPDAVIPSNHRRKWEALAGYAELGPVEVLLVASGARWWLDAFHDGDQLRVVPRDPL